MEANLIAPCGMNCGICSAYLAYKHEVKEKGLMLAYCKGCRPRNKQCAFLKKKCKTGLLLKGEVEYCYECPEYPCARLKHLDHRYITNYGESFIENLDYIKANGIDAFLSKETEKWRCPECGDVISCHNNICYNCGLDKMKAGQLNTAGKVISHNSKARRAADG